MADDITANGVGPVAADLIAGVYYPRTKLVFGPDGTNSGDVSAANPLPVIDPYLPAGTNRSGTIAVGGTAQTISTGNATRRALYGQNISTGDLWINELGGVAVIGAAGSYKISPGESFSISTSNAISIIGATTGQAYTAVEL
jgi:hypothetical protein